MRFQEHAESEIAAALRTLIAPTTEAVLGELEALRVAFDVRCETMKDAVARPPSITPAWLREVTDRLARTAAEEADAAARTARSQAVEQAQACLELERAEANRRLESARAEAASQRDVDQLERAALRKEFDEARAQVDAVRAHAEAQLEAARAARTQLLEDTRAQIEAACEEAERALTAQRQSVADLRAQLETAQAEAQQARADAERVGRATQVRRAAAQAELEAPTEPVAPTTLIHPPAPARAAPAEALAPAPAEPEAAKDDRLKQAFRALDEAATLTQVLDALLDGVGAACPRAALFQVKPDQLQGWRSLGFPSEAAITTQFTLSLAADSVLTRAATTSRAIVTGASPTRDLDATPAGANRELWTVTLPVTVGDRVVAVVYADEGARMGGTPSFDREFAFKVSEQLVRHGGQRLAALAATDQTAGSHPTTETPTTPDASDASPERKRQKELERIEDARRYARLLASEIKRYHDAGVAEAPDRNVSERLKDEIERCRRLYAGRVPPEARSTVNFFDEMLFEILGRREVEVLGQVEATVESSQLLRT